MKKLIALCLVLTLAVNFAACANTPEAPVQSNEPAVEENTTPEDNTTPQEGPAASDNSALQVLETIWALYGEDEKFPVMGGNPEVELMDAPGAFDMAYTESLSNFLKLSADQLAKVDQAATMIHMMNANTFTSGVLHLREGVDVAEFAQSIRDSVQSAHWICGFPEQVIVAVVDGQILMAFGAADLIATFETHLTTAYVNAEILFNEAIVG